MLKVWKIQNSVLSNHFAFAQCQCYWRCVQLIFAYFVDGQLFYQPQLFNSQLFSRMQCAIFKCLFLIFQHLYNSHINNFSV